VGGGAQGEGETEGFSSRGGAMPKMSAALGGIRKGKQPPPFPRAQAQTQARMRLLLLLSSPSQSPPQTRSCAADACAVQRAWE